MKCPKCKNENVTINMVSETEYEKKKHGFLYKITIGWLLFVIKWVFFTFPAILLKVFGFDKGRAVNKAKKIAVCQDCGNSWDIK